MEKLLTVSELGDKLSVARSWIYHRTRQKGSGRIPHIRAGKYCRFRLEDVLEWLEKQNPQDESRG